MNFRRLLVISLLVVVAWPFSTAIAVNTPNSTNTKVNEQTDFYLQVGAFAYLDHAKQLSQQLQDNLHQPVRISESHKDEHTLYKVQVGPLASAQLAHTIRQQINMLQHPDATSTSSIPAIQPLHIAASTATEQRFKQRISKTKPTNAFSKPAPKKPAPARIWNLRNADIRSVIDEVSRITGKNFLIDPRVQGKVTIVANKPLSPDAVYQVFLSALQVSGYAAVRTGQVTKIVPSMNAKVLATRVTGRVAPGQGDEVVVRVIPIKYVTADQLVPALRPLIPEWGSISAYRPANTLIISGRAANVKRIAKIISRVDTSSSNGYDVVPVRNASADALVKTLKSLQQDTSKISSQQASIAADDRGNAIILSGNKAARLRMKVLISQLDQSTPGGNGNTQVIFLRYMQAKDMVPILAGVARANYSGPVGTVIGSTTVQNAPTADTSEMYDTASGTGSGGSLNLSVASSSDSRPTSSTPASTSSSGNQDSDKPKVEIIADPNTNSLIINAPSAVMRNLKTVITKLDVRPAQVLVEAIIAEINEDDIKQLGISWGSIVTQSTTNPDGTITPSSSSFQPGIAIINKDINIKNFEARVTALANKNKLDILSTPTVVVLNNHQAKILVGKQVSVEDSTFPNNANGTTTASPYTTFDRQNVALHLYVTPQINRGSAVKMVIDHGNDTLQDPNDNSGRPIINTSSIKTSVIVNTGNILVLGGLIQNQLSNADQSLPVLGKLPGLGQLLFHDRKRRRTKRALMVFLRPIILANPTDGLHVTESRYNNLRKEQLAWLRKQPYANDLKGLVMKPFGKDVRLPKPFSTQ